MSSVTTTVVPNVPTGAGDVAVTVDWDADTVSVPKVTAPCWPAPRRARRRVGGGEVTSSAAASVAVKVTTPEAFVTFGVAAGVMTALPVPRA